MINLTQKKETGNYYILQIKNCVENRNMGWAPPFMERNKS